jgi:mRNA interferase RelE/StbE
MTYEVQFDPKATEFLNTLDKELRHRIFKKILSTKSNPFHFFERLVERGDYKLKVGKYRIIADIDMNQKIIFITLIGHRKNVYEK